MMDNPPPNDDTLPLILEKLIQQNLDLGQQILALSAICATALRELCLQSSDPLHRLMLIEGEIMGIADAVAHSFGTSSSAERTTTQSFSELVERVLRMSSGNLSVCSRMT